MDIITLALAKSGARSYTDQAISSLGSGFTYKGSVSSIGELPFSAEPGDEYTVGTLGAYVYDGTNWKPAGQKGAKGDKGEKGDRGERGEGVLPTPISNGRALISVNGEWIQQSGYGYETINPESEQLTPVSPYYHIVRVGDVPNIPSNLQVGDPVTAWIISPDSDNTPITLTVTTVTDQGAVFVVGESLPVISIIPTDDYSATHIDIDPEAGDDTEFFSYPEAGIYFQATFVDDVNHYVSGFAFGENASEPIITWDGEIASVVPIDEKFIPDIFIKKEELHIDKVIDSSSTHNSVPTSLAVKDYVDNNSLPTPESDGVALVGVNGEWKQQDGYGYEDNSELVNITLGELSSITEFFSLDGYKAHKVYPNFISETDASEIYLKITQGEEPIQVKLTDDNYIYIAAFNENLIQYIYGSELIMFSAKAGTYDSEGTAVVIPSDGFYIVDVLKDIDPSDPDYELWVNTRIILTRNSTHPIDPKFIPSDSTKQNISDDTLETLNKTVPGAINETRSIALGVNRAVSFDSYSAMITSLNSAAKDVHRLGQNIYILTVAVPDLWVSSVEETSVPYTYTTDAAFTSALNTDGYVQIGYYKVSALETQKVILTDYSTTAQMNAAISQAIGGAINASY